MVLIRPMIRANQDRFYNVHVFVFFIFLVANIGGSLTPLGDPPLFLGFLKGVDFLWTLEHMLGPMLFMSSLLLRCSTSSTRSPGTVSGQRLGPRAAWSGKFASKTS
jgi:Na+/H+ antiporter NhaD/arsenite permease-like protein